jgi:hypothetical protein
MTWSEGDSTTHSWVWSRWLSWQVSQMTCSVKVLHSAQ